jgi:predicted nucleotidyltransferase
MIKEEKIEHNPLTPSIIAQIQEYVSNETPIDLLLLYGSRAEERETPLSDIDFAYYSSSPLSFDKEADILFELGRIVGTHEVDLSAMGTLPLKSRYLILYEGKLIYCRDKILYYDLKEEMTNLYLDFKYYDDIYLKTQAQILQEAYGKRKD